MKKKAIACLILALSLMSGPFAHAGVTWEERLEKSARLQEMSLAPVQDKTIVGTVAVFCLISSALLANHSYVMTRKAANAGARTDSGSLYDVKRQRLDRSEAYGTAALIVGAIGMGFTITLLSF